MGTLGAPHSMSHNSPGRLQVPHCQLQHTSPSGQTVHPQRSGGVASLVDASGRALGGGATTVADADTGASSSASSAFASPVPSSSLRDASATGMGGNACGLASGTTAGTGFEA
jgi:hypothetical protein